MKKEIEALLRSDDAVLRLNQFTRLTRWKVYELGKIEPKYDGLEVSFSINSAIEYTQEIKARDWQGIVEEVKEATTTAFELASERLNKELSNGYVLEFVKR